MTFRSRAGFIRALFPRLLLALAVLFPVLSGQGPAPAGATGRSMTAEEATPDSIPGEASAAPALGQARHLAQLGVQRWHDAGFRGQGVKIAVLDTGFQGYKNFLGQALPEQVSVRSFRRDGNAEAKGSQH